MEDYVILGLIIIIIILYYLTSCGKRDFPDHIPHRKPHIPHRPRFPHRQTISGRYVTITQPGFYSYLNFNEIEIYSTDQVTNVALNKNATSLTIYGSIYGPQNAVDGDITTFFNSATAGSGQWLQVDLGENMTITKIVVYSRPGLSGRMNGCVLTVSDEGNNIIYTSSFFPSIDGGSIYGNDDSGYPIYTVNPPNPTVITSS